MHSYSNELCSNISNPKMSSNPINSSLWGALLSPTMASFTLLTIQLNSCPYKCFAIVSLARYDC